MRGILILITLQMMTVHLYAQDDSKNAYKEYKKLFNKYKQSSSLIQSDPRWSINLEMGILPISSVGGQSDISYRGLLGFEYQLFDQFNIGAFFQTVLYVQDKDLMSIEGKIVDMSSVDMNSMGISLGYLVDFNKFYLEPKVNISYDIFNVKAIDYAYDNNAFIDYKFLTLNSKLVAGYHISQNISLGMYGGYNYQVLALKGEKTESFDPNGINFGLNSRIKINL